MCFAPDCQAWLRIRRALPVLDSFVDLAANLRVQNVVCTWLIKEWVRA